MLVNSAEVRSEAHDVLVLGSGLAGMAAVTKKGQVSHIAFSAALL